MMKCLILVIVAFAALASAKPQNGITLDNYKELGNPSKGYRFGFETNDPQRRQEEAKPKNVNNMEILSVEGKYSYDTPDGGTYEVQYIADELGYRIKAVVLTRPGGSGSGTGAVSGSGVGGGAGGIGGGAGTGSGATGPAVDSTPEATSNYGEDNAYFLQQGGQRGNGYEYPETQNDGGVNGGDANGGFPDDSYYGNAQTGSSSFVGNGPDAGSVSYPSGGDSSVTGTAGRTGYEYPSPQGGLEY